MGASETAIRQALASRKLRHERTLAAPPRSFLEISELSAQEFRSLIASGIDIKTNPKRYENALQRRQVALVFQKTSPRGVA